MAEASRLARWIARPAPNARAQVRLVCVPYAGGGASIFREWPKLLPPEVELCVAQLPGREARFSEPLEKRAAPIVAALAGALAPLGDLPLAVFGHSMGGLIAFELARALERSGEQSVLAAFVSGRSAPHLRDPERLHELSDAAMLAGLQKLGGMPREVLEHAELLQLVLPILRADLAVDETAVVDVKPPLRCPLVVLGGRRDPLVPVESLEAWRGYTRGQARVALCDGDHFFLQTERAFTLGEIARELTARLALGDA